MPAGFRSIVGRRLGLTSTGGLGQYLDSTGGGSTALTTFFSQWGSGQIVVVSSSGATIGNSGMTYLSTADSTAARTFTLAAPVAGIRKEVLAADCSATLITFQATGAGYTFQSSADSSAFTLAAAVTGLGMSVTLLGISSTLWAVTNKYIPG